MPTNPTESSKNARPLFVSGCERSGTTAFADYLNRHPEILVLRERYRFHPGGITPDLFDFDRILDFTEADRDERRKIDDWYKNLTAGMIADKDPAELAWIGDKDPFYLEDLEDLHRNNPGARFIILYRPVEEVAESWQARSNDPEDVWPGRKDFEEGVKGWNWALRRIREFIEGALEPEVLLLDYHDFFYRNGLCVKLISDFLELEFDESVRSAWEALSLEFESNRRQKASLSKDQAAFIEENKDNEAEAWILARIAGQWETLGMAPEDEDPALRKERRAATAALLAARGEAQSHALKTEDLARQLEQSLSSLENQRRRNERLTAQLEDIRSSRSWQLVSRLARLRTRLFGR